jgi:hypothetical protein
VRTTRCHTLRPTASTRQHGPRALAAIISERGRVPWLVYRTSIRADHVICPRLHTVHLNGKSRWTMIQERYLVTISYTIGETKGTDASKTLITKGAIHDPRRSYHIYSRWRYLIYRWYATYKDTVQVSNWNFTPNHHENGSALRRSYQDSTTSTWNHPTDHMLTVRTYRCAYVCTSIYDFYSNRYSIESTPDTAVDIQRYQW